MQMQRPPSKTKEFDLRKATQDDVSQLVAVERRAHSGSAPETAFWTEQNFESELDKPYSQVLLMTDEETDEVVAGFIVFWLMLDECQILNVAVDPEHRRKGFAKEMVRKAIDMAVRQNMKKVFLNVRKSNRAAIELYQKQQLTVVGVRKRFYSDGEDAYEMAIDLTAERIEF